jgi:FlaA1/EpsC-like NDP-sugar epimerase
MRETVTWGVKMKSKSSMSIVGIIGGIIVAFTLAAFFLLDYDRVAVHWWALTFLLLSEVVLFSGLVGLKYADRTYNGFFYRSGIFTTLSLYLLATLIVALLVGFFRENVNIFILIHLAIITLFAIIILLLYSFSRKLERQGEKDIKKIGTNEPKRGGF